MLPAVGALRIQGRMRYYVLRIIASFFLFFACTDLVQPLTQPPQRIDEVFFNARVWWEATPPEGILTVAAFAADPSFRATAHTELPFELRSSSGDAESVSFTKALCSESPDQGAQACDRITVYMRDGFNVQDLHSRLRTLEGRYTTSPTIGWFAGIQLFGISIADATRQVRGWPGVRDVGPVSVFYPPGSTLPWDEWVGRTLRADTKLDVRSPIVGNGTLELLEGDTVTVRYLQPDSSVYTKAFFFPPRPSSSAESQDWHFQELPRMWF